MTETPQRFLHRTEEAEAVQWTGTNADRLRAFCGPDFDTIDPEDRTEDPDETAAVRTHPHGGWLGLTPGDWVLKVGEGRFTALRDAEFRAAWEPAAVPSPDQTALRERIAEALWAANGPSAAEEANVDAVLAVLPPPADRAAVLHEAAEALWNHPRASAIDSDFRSASDVLRRLAAEAQQPDTETPGLHAQYLEAARGALQRHGQVDGTEAAELIAAAMLDARDRAMEQLCTERDLAVAHDRQPYPTAWSYEQACKALHKHEQRADSAEAAITRVREWLAGLDVVAAELAGEGARHPVAEHVRQLLDQQPKPERTLCSDPPCNEGGTGEPCDAHETEQAHADGEHAFCGPTCEVEFPSEMLRNTILCRAYPGSSQMLDELLRRAAAGKVPGLSEPGAEVKAEHHVVDGATYLCHSGDHYCPGAQSGAQL
ncbi:hypothetical protein [Streptomyces sp. NPDC001139]